MKAVTVNPSTRRVRLLDREDPSIVTPTQVKLRMLDVGVCGTDREICAFEYGTPPAGSDHLVIGRESLGVVQEIGPAVRISALRAISTKEASRKPTGS